MVPWGSEDEHVAVKIIVTDEDEDEEEADEEMEYHGGHLGQIDKDDEDEVVFCGRRRV